MTDYKSISYCTANEDRKEEITVTYDLGLFEWSKLMLRSGSVNIEREVTDAYVGEGTIWVNKMTGKATNNEMQHRLGMIKYELLNKEVNKS